MMRWLALGVVHPLAVKKCAWLYEIAECGGDNKQMA